MKRCDDCFYEWEERVEEPVECPRCKSRDWNKKIKKEEEEDD